MNWINVTTRVPDNRRRVLVSGHTHVFGLKRVRAVEFSHYNPGACFDIEVPGRFSHFTVTHWAEIEFPKQYEMGQI